MATGVQIEIETARRLVGLLKPDPGGRTDLHRTTDDFIRFFKAPSGGIPGRAGTLLGVATCTLYGVGTTDLTITDRTIEFEVANWTTSAVCSTGDRFGLAGLWNGVWWVISEDCSTSGGGGGSEPAGVTDGSSDGPDLTSLSRFSTVITNQTVDPDLAPWETAMSPPSPGDEGPGA